MTSVRRDKYRYFACLLRDRFDKNKNVKDMVKATELLKAGEEEFWANQHPQPYIFADSPGGIAYERYEMYKVRQGTRPGDCQPLVLGAPAPALRVLCHLTWTGPQLGSAVSLHRSMDILLLV